MHSVRRSQWDIIIFLSGVGVVVLLDRLTKHILSGFLGLNESITVIPHILRFTLVHNTGIAFGFFRDCGAVFIIIPVILTGLLIYNICYYRHSPHLSRTYVVAFSLILGGAIGNLIDRILLGYVIDFIDFRIWPVFNVADSAITIGAAIILLKCIPASK
ncbi:MAG: signal peptidase II [Candidatus Omnitrophica bacterium]|nr:signal peptidase II [Candidatus Omnitrophota bacterium]MDE2008964.1 signal peptidase II [Candidatus Omnitrophota bacterium]MDE2214488.1 signal peptidase II [Candidatus Omnitrophota bacterium]MDE2230806.1 signal peptidase II [Candidatus Omnitrophota bacterium]